VSIGEKFLAAERRPDAPLPVIASAVKTPASSINDAAIIANAYFRMSPSQEEKAPRSGASDARLRAAESPRRLESIPRFEEPSSADLYYIGSHGLKL
jgi:hypothetical protein